MLLSLPSELREVVKDLDACVRALGPYEEDAMLVGGLVPLLYRIAFPAPIAAANPLTTFDIDWVLPVPLAIRDNEGLHARMLKADFVPTETQTVKSDNPKVRYHHARHGKSRLAPIHVEFLGPRSGGSTDRKGKDCTLREIQNGLIAELLPYLNVLQFRPLAVNVSQLEGWGEPSSIMVRVPHPACYVVQKALIREKRLPDKKDNDAAQIYDVAMLTRRIWPQIAAVVEDLESANFPRTWLRRASACLQQMFADPAADGTRGVCRTFRDFTEAKHRPTEDAVFRAMRAFLSAAKFA